VSPAEVFSPLGFTIRLLFPDGGSPSIIYPVHHGMPVSTLRQQIATLLSVPVVHLLVCFSANPGSGLSWHHDILEHVGSITDRLFPDTNVPCPFLQRGSRVNVFFERPRDEESDPNGANNGEHAQIGENNGEHGAMASSTVFNDAPLPLPPILELPNTASIPLNRLQRHNLLKRFNAEGRHLRRVHRAELEREWDEIIAPAFDQENDVSDGAMLVEEEVAFDEYMFERLARYDEDFEAEKADFIDDLSCATLHGNLYPQGVSEERATDRGPDEFLMRRTAELWAGLRRVYFGEVEDGPDLDDLLFPTPSAKKQRRRTQEAVIRWILSERLPRPAHGFGKKFSLFLTILTLHHHFYLFNHRMTMTLMNLLFFQLLRYSFATLSLTTMQSLSLLPVPRFLILVGLLHAASCYRYGKFGGSWRRGKLCSSLGFSFLKTIGKPMLLLNEAARWKAGRDLEWLRLNEQGIFDPDWSFSRMTDGGVSFVSTTRHRPSFLCLRLQVFGRTPSSSRV
jgi:hypothetical protein